jgi:single-strand DNA-binding protein
MASLNRIILIGNVGKDPEVRTTANGAKVAQISLATSRQWTANGKKEEKTEWHRCVVWNRGKSTLADLVERYVAKGDKLCIEGSVEYRQYEKDGQTRYLTEINVSSITLLGGKSQPKQPETPSEDVDDYADDSLPF